ncbi:dienelactone hydrolase family protein [Williamsia maris]
MNRPSGTTEKDAYMDNQITLATPQGPIQGTVATPDGTGPWPGVVIVHDIVAARRGGMPEIIDRVANAGYLVIAPDLYSRGGPLRCVTRVVTEMRRGYGRSYDDLASARSYLVSHPQCSGATGIIGFCMGGGFALAMASNGFDASAPFYPSLPPSAYGDISGGACPVVASFGRRDPLLRGAGPRLRDALGDRGVVHDIKTYPDSGHAFANPHPAAPLLRVLGFGHNPTDTEDAWNRVFTFFDKHLNTRA